MSWLHPICSQKHCKKYETLKEIRNFERASFKFFPRSSFYTFPVPFLLYLLHCEDNTCLNDANNYLCRYEPGKVLELAAIDNGLAFPVKHPETSSRLRQFPFAWAQLSWANYVRIF